MSQKREQIGKTKTTTVRPAVQPDEGVGAPWATPPVPRAAVMKSQHAALELIEEVLG